MESRMRTSHMPTAPGGEQRPLRLLSLDGGGVRGLSTIIILKHLMRRLNAHRDKDKQLQPWQVFDLIGGTSTGGLIAVMLGRLRMTLDECEQAYLTLSESIFQPKREKWRVISRAADLAQAKGRFDARALEQAIKETIRSKGLDPNTALLKDDDPRCKVFVCAARAENSDVAILRSYQNSCKTELLYDHCRIWEACNATSTATTFIDPVALGPHNQGLFSGAMLHNNPIKLVHREARDLWPGRKSFLLSIGTGSTSGQSLKGGIKTTAKGLKAIVTQTEKTADEFYLSHPDMVKEGLLFRFNVLHGLSDVGPEVSKQHIATATQTYLDNGETIEKTDKCIAALLKTGLKGSDNSSHRAIAEWLTPVNVLQRQMEILDIRHPGTGKWLLELDTFRDWLSGKQKTLFCCGIPGSGKTVLASLVIDHLTRSWDHNVAIAGVYCRSPDHLQRTPGNLIAEILKQLILCQRRPGPLSREIQNLYETNVRNKTIPSFDKFVAVLRTELSRFKRAFIVVDGLDALSVNEETLSRFVNGLTSLGAHVNVMITSRPHIDVGRIVKNAVRVDIKASNADIRKYLTERIPKIPRLAALVDGHRDLYEAIVQSVTDNAQGMFLYARLQLQSLASKSNRNELRKALAETPPGLDTIYQEALQKLQKQEASTRLLAFRALAWASCSFRALTLPEVQHALAVSPGKRSITADDITDGHILVSVCAGLLSVDPRTQVITLVHPSARKWLLRTLGDKFHDAHTYMASTCLAYLMLDVFPVGEYRDDAETARRFKKYPFFGYAVKHWGEHAQRAPEVSARAAQLSFPGHSPGRVSKELMASSGFRRQLASLTTLLSLA
ncbi:hypothetical protein VTO42DRAFT_2857 [Malbranchea cinnamomea]